MEYSVFVMNIELLKTRKWANRISLREVDGETAFEWAHFRSIKLSRVFDFTTRVVYFRFESYKRRFWRLFVREIYHTILSSNEHSDSDAYENQTDGESGRNGWADCDMRPVGRQILLTPRTFQNIWIKSTLYILLDTDRSVLLAPLSGNSRDVVRHFEAQPIPNHITYVMRRKMKP